ncbi:1,4-beta-xylanase [Bacillus sp. WMMC1349]|uniref:glycoside hydrolase family 113 n=1 Tax=Bacillus sp. WMMC1349 TaxID=2736254 RepID=UPI0020A68ADE|nr:1,4-beta-xylanase [Bacillus sp. WMMC1349]
MEMGTINDERVSGLDTIKGFTYGWLSGRGKLLTEKAKISLRLMKERTYSTHVVIALAAQQDTAQSTKIDFTGYHFPSDDELIEWISYAQSLGLRVIMKPTVNVRDGTWRAHINFFDIDVPCEPKWGDWFASYTDYQLHYARIAEKTGCDMHIVGCEMVQSERREHDWRRLISSIKQVYSGLVSYNTDKYQEGNVKWWDAVDVISSSGYYPIHDWERQLNRIEKIITPFKKPFFFAEAGCPSRSGSSLIPNDWLHQGQTNTKEQAEFYQEMFKTTHKRPWVKGFGLWDWRTELYQEDEAHLDDGYDVYGKPAEKVIAEFYQAGGN